MASDTRNDNITPADPEGPTSPPPQLPDGWLAQWEGASQKYYFVQRATGQSQWDIPTQPAPSVPTPTATPQSTQTYPPPADGEQPYEGSERSFFSSKPTGMPNQQMSVPGQQNLQQGQYGQPSQFGQNPQYQQGMGGSSLGNFAQGILGRVADRILPPKQQMAPGQAQQQGQYGQNPAYQQGMGQQQGLLPSLTHGLFSHHGGQHQNQQNFGYSSGGPTTGYTGTAPPSTFQATGQSVSSPPSGQPTSQFSPSPGTLPGQAPAQFGQQQGLGATQQFGADAHGGLSSQFSQPQQHSQVTQGVYGAQQQPNQPLNAQVGQQTAGYGYVAAAPPQPQWQQQNPGPGSHAQSQPPMGYGQTASYPLPPAQSLQSQSFPQGAPGLTQQAPFPGQAQGQFSQQTPGLPTAPVQQNQQSQSTPSSQFSQSPGVTQQSQPFPSQPINPYAPGPGQPPYGQGYPQSVNQQQQGAYGQNTQPQFPQSLPGQQPGQFSPMGQSPQASGPQFGQQTNPMGGMSQNQSPFPQNQQQQGGPQFPSNPNPSFGNQQRPGAGVQSPSQQSIGMSGPPQPAYSQAGPGMGQPLQSPQMGMGGPTQSPVPGPQGNLGPQGGYPGR